MKMSLMQKPRNKIAVLAMALLGVFLSSCANNLPVKRVPEVDLSRFMGAWYVIACIPTFIEKDAYNAVESYQLNKDASIATTFTYNKGSLDGPLKIYKPKGFVVENTGNALWGMQFIWPIRSEFVISYLDADYSTTVIARTARDYVWIMSRTPDITDEKYAELKEYVRLLGYDDSKLRKIPHQVTHSSEHQEN